jgi:hypothetical protein
MEKAFEPDTGNPSKPRVRNTSAEVGATSGIIQGCFSPGGFYFQGFGLEDPSRGMFASAFFAFDVYSQQLGFPSGMDALAHDRSSRWNSYQEAIATAFGHPLYYDYDGNLQCTTAWREYTDQQREELIREAEEMQERANRWAAIAGLFSRRLGLLIESVGTVGSASTAFGRESGC